MFKKIAMMLVFTWLAIGTEVYSGFSTLFYGGCLASAYLVYTRAAASDSYVEKGIIWGYEWWYAEKIKQNREARWEKALQVKKTAQPSKKKAKKVTSAPLTSSEGSSSGQSSNGRGLKAWVNNTQKKLTQKADEINGKVVKTKEEVGSVIEGFIEDAVEVVTQAAEETELWTAPIYLKNTYFSESWFQNMIGKNACYAGVIALAVPAGFGLVKEVCYALKS